MNNYTITKHPFTGELMWLCEYTPESVLLVEKFIKENYHENYTLSIFDSVTNRTLEIVNPVNEIIDEVTKIIDFVSNTEHTFVKFIGINSISNSYVVGVDFTRGRIPVPSFYRCENGKLVSIKKDN